MGGAMILGPDFREFVEYCERHELAMSSSWVTRLIGSTWRVQPSGVTFDSCWHRRIRVDLGGVTASVIGFDDLIVNKRASGRPRDLADIDDLGLS